MAKVSIIIPSRNEKYLQRTIEDIYAKATGEFEIIVGMNGSTDFGLKLDKKYMDGRITITREDQAIGLKPMINKLVTLATGKYIYKSDAHCMFGKGFDEILQKDMEHDWVVTPRFYVLDAEKWQWQDDRFYDYFYLSCPFTDPKGLRFKAGGHWPERTASRNFPNYPDIDETPSMHGSGWFVSKDYFLNTLGGFPTEDPLGHAQEPIWLGLKAWLMGGKLMVNKKTWYAHLHQDSKDRGYPEDKKHTEKTYNWTAEYWLTNTGKLKYSFEQFVDKFMPMPTWPENWKEMYAEYLKLHS